MERQITEKQIKALLRYINDSDLSNLLWMVQKFAAGGMNKK